MKGNKRLLLPSVLPTFILQTVCFPKLLTTFCAWATVVFYGMIKRYGREIISPHFYNYYYIKKK